MTQTTCPKCFQTEDKCDCPPELGPHRYVATTVSKWRTCQLCGQGASAQIHK